MSAASTTLNAALDSRKLGFITQALDEVREWLRYQLKPPYTEIVRLKADEEPLHFAVEFTARLYLHYAGVQKESEGLVFSMQFSGATYTDSPSPPVDELFNAGLMDAFEVYGYGRRWEGEAISIPGELLQKLEIPAQTLNRIPIQEFLNKISLT